MNITNQPFLPAKILSAAEVEKIANSMGQRAAGSPITVGEDGSVSIIGKSEEEDTRDTIASMNAHGAAAYIQAGDAINTMTREISKVGREVGLQRPDLKSKDWDFAIKDGKFVVNGRGLTKDDTKLIEDKLNSNQPLLGAATSFMAAAVKNLQISDDYQGGITNTIYSVGTRQIAFDHVAEQLNGAIDFKKFLAHNEDLASYHGKNQIDDAFRGLSALELLGSKLDSNAKTIGYSVFPSAR